MFSRLSLLTLLFLGFTLIFTPGTVLAQAQQEFLEVAGGDGEYRIGDTLTVTFFAPLNTELRINAQNVTITGIGILVDLKPPAAGIPGMYTTDPDFGSLVVQGTIHGSPAFISAFWDRRVENDLFARVDLEVIAENPRIVVDPPLVPDIVFGQAVRVFNKYKYTFEHPDIHEFFPDVLNAFKDPRKRGALNPAVIKRFAYEPKYIWKLYADTDDSILILLLLDAAFQNLFLDDQFHTLVTRPTEVDELVRLIRQTTPRPRDDGCEPPASEPPKATTLSIVSGFGQDGKPGSRLDQPFVVEVRDQYGDPFPDATVNFTVKEGGGRLSRTAVTTTNGQASVILTLGPNPGSNWVVASVEGIPSQTFTAIALDDQREAATLTIVSGDDQQGYIGTELRSPFVVEVRDQYGEPFPGATVKFEVEKGGGSLSRTTEHTNRAGRVSVTLTLGSEVGEIQVVASVEGISQTQAFIVTVINADVNSDGVVNIIDLAIVLSLMVDPERGINGVDADINMDGNVNYRDFILVNNALDSTAAAPSVHALVQGGISAADIRVLLTQAKTLPEATEADPVYQRGIVALEQLLATLTQVPVVPKQTALLVNYPNPFNPETWIPYQLSEASDVTVSIYAVDGRLIRTLALGHQPAGLYQRKDQAAYWDGQNAFGEPVASGLYFYTLQAGDFTATRKMLIRK